MVEWSPGAQTLEHTRVEKIEFRVLDERPFGSFTEHGKAERQKKIFKDGDETFHCLTLDFAFLGDGG